MRFKLIAALILTCNVSILSISQDQIGINPPSLKWSKIITPAGDIIYPRGLDSTATSLACRINSAFLLDDREVLMQSPGKRITTILQNQSSDPEGFTTTAPWRQELFLTPPQNMFMGPTIWNDGLTTHEYRHAQQFMAYNRGITNGYKVLMGNTGWIFSSVLNMPLWYREGDAVDAETRFTTGGRGTLPAFNMEYRTLLLNDIDFGYEKAISASNFKDFVPNHYRTGYYLTKHLRNERGSEICASILEESTKRPFYSFSRALKNTIGNKAPEFYDIVIDSLKSNWQKTDTVREIIGTRISAPQGVFSKFRFPQKDLDGSLICSHISLERIRTLVTLDEDAFKTLTVPGIYTTDHQNFTVEGNIITWAESAYHPRYRNKIYSVIKSFDKTSGKLSQITHRSKLFSPAPSKDGSMIAAVEYDEFENCSIKIINRENHAVISTHSYQGQFLTQPRWIDNDEIIMLSINEDGNSIVSLNILEDQWELVLNGYDINISQPFSYQNEIYFSAGLGGIENIFKINTTSKKVYQMTNARFGAFDPSVYSDTLYFANYDLMGYEIWQTPLENALNREVSFPTKPVYRSKPNYLNDEVKERLDSVLIHNENYKGFFWNKFFHFYGWFPLIAPPEYGIELNSLNLERSFRSLVGISYHTEEKLFQSRIQLDYAKYYPIISGIAKIKTRDFEFSTFEFNPDSIPSLLTNESEYGGQVSLPFRLTQGVYSTNFSVSGSFMRHEVENLQSNSKLDFSSTAYSVSFSRLRPKALRQINSRFGQSLQFFTKRGFDDVSIEQNGFKGDLFFPGVSRTHSFFVSGGFEENKNTYEYRFESQLRGSRGYDFYPFDERKSIRLNYELPLMYPDKYIRGVIGTSRVRLNMFYDYTEGNSYDWAQLQRSYGLELGFDIRLLRAFNMGLKLRFSHSIDRVANRKPFAFNFAADYFDFAN